MRQGSMPGRRIADILRRAEKKQRGQGRGRAVVRRQKTAKKKIIHEVRAQSAQQVIIRRGVQGQHIAAEALQQSQKHMRLIGGKPGVLRGFFQKRSKPGPAQQFLSFCG